MVKYWWILSVLLLSLVPIGCVNQCKVVLPVIVKTQSIVTDAAFALNQVEAIVDTVPMPENIKAQLKVALAKGEAGLKAANAILIACEDLCKTPDVATIFADYNKAWAEIRSILTLFGKSGAGIEFRAGSARTLSPASELLFPDPIAFTAR